MLALILATKTDKPADFSKSTLIGERLFLCHYSSSYSMTYHMTVVPLSVMSNWEQQIQEHCVPGTLSSCTYYGTNRSMSPQELMEYDVVITTYQTVAGEHLDAASVSGPSKKKKKKIERSLFDIQWKVRSPFFSPPYSYSHPRVRELSSMRDITFEIRRRRWPKQYAD
jgi:SWI/SNF-related matrix-associated actin-dependent regulator of chromatin subfamily A3